MDSLKYKLSDFAVSLVQEDRDVYYESLEFLKCPDPLLIPLRLYISANVRKLLPPIERYHLVFYLVLERYISESERYEAYKKSRFEAIFIQYFHEQVTSISSAIRRGTAAFSCTIVFSTCGLRQVMEVVLNITPATITTPDQMLDHVADYVRAKINAALDRVAFEERKQGPSESFDEFYIELLH